MPKVLEITKEKLANLTPLKAILKNSATTVSTSVMPENYGGREAKSKINFINPTFMSNEDQNLIWVDIKAIPIFKLSNNARAIKAITTETDSLKASEALAIKLDAPIYTFKFLAQQELIEQISHSWEPYDSYASFFAKLYSDIGISIPEQVAGLADSIGVRSLDEAKSKLKSLIPKISNSVSNGTAFKDGVKSMFGAISSAATSGTVANFRVDTPLQYKGSERRNFELIFNLINTEKGMNHSNVVLPVKLLEMFSSPSYNITPDKNANADIILPYLFEINTSPGDLLYIDLAVLKGVQPTWKGPWIDGYPSRCELRLSFTEYRPLEQGVFYNNTEHQIIQVIQKERAVSYNKIINQKLNKNKPEIRGH